MCQFRCGSRDEAQFKVYDIPKTSSTHLSSVVDVLVLLVSVSISRISNFIVLPGACPACKSERSPPLEWGNAKLAMCTVAASVASFPNDVRENERQEIERNNPACHLEDPSSMLQAPQFL